MDGVRTTRVATVDFKSRARFPPLCGIWVRGLSGDRARVGSGLGRGGPEDILPIMNGIVSFQIVGTATRNVALPPNVAATSETSLQDRCIFHQLAQKTR